MGGGIRALDKHLAEIYTGKFFGQSPNHFHGYWKKEPKFRLFCLNVDDQGKIVTQVLDLKFNSDLHHLHFPNCSWLYKRECCSIHVLYMSIHNPYTRGLKCACVCTLVGKRSDLECTDYEVSNYFFKGCRKMSLVSNQTRILSQNYQTMTTAHKRLTVHGMPDSAVWLWNLKQMVRPEWVGSSLEEPT